MRNGCIGPDREGTRSVRAAASGVGALAKDNSGRGNRHASSRDTQKREMLFRDAVAGRNGAFAAEDLMRRSSISQGRMRLLSACLLAAVIGSALKIGEIRSSAVRYSREQRKAGDFLRNKRGMRFRFFCRLRIGQVRHGLTPRSCGVLRSFAAAQPGAGSLPRQKPRGRVPPEKKF